MVLNNNNCFNGDALSSYATLYETKFKMFILCSHIVKQYYIENTQNNFISNKYLT